MLAAASCSAAPLECLTLNAAREVTGGSPEALRTAIAKGGDLRIYTGFRYNEHIDVKSSNHELVNEISDFRVTWLVDNRWVAGVMNLRMPVVPPGVFGPVPSWSFFLYNEDGSQAIARPFLDGQKRAAPSGPCATPDPADMSKYHIISDFDKDSNGPAQNFVYAFESYRFWVSDCWREVYAHDENGKRVSGDFGELMREFMSGNELKASIRDFDRQPGDPTCELFTHLGSGYQSTETGGFCVNTQPLVVVRPAVPMRYATGNWSFGNMIIKSNGEVVYWRCDPYTMKYDKVTRRCPVRYFVRRGNVK